MVNFTLLAGGYTSFVSTYVFNSDSNVLSLSGQSPTGENPSWIALHPTNKSVLYAVNEDQQGALQAFTIDGNGLLSDAISTVDSGGMGRRSRFRSVPGQVAIMNYGSGNGKIIPTTGDPLHFDTSNATETIAFPAPVSHPHMALQNGNEVLVPDLGADTVWRLAQASNDTPGAWTIQGAVAQPAGSGPRHIALVGGCLYTLHETSSTLTAQMLPPAPNGTAPALAANLSIVPPDASAGAAFAAGELLVAPASQADSRGDAVAVFKAGPLGTLALADHVYTGLEQVRGMQFFGDEDRYLVAGGMVGGAGVMVFERTGSGGNLTLRAQNSEVQNRTSFVWMD
ncbi:putative isomerase YbhE [Phellopilus nigrolimitatus]|nr:putative isomerase YbhE [Phellopilus nigrolimitatus]